MFHVRHFREHTWGQFRQIVHVADRVYGGHDHQTVTLYGAVSQQRGKVYFERRAKTFYDAVKFVAFFRELLSECERAWTTFVLDNAPIHKSRKATKFFREEQLDVLFLPTYSPHLNPIETVWSIYKKDFYSRLAKKKSLNLPPKVLETLDETDASIS